VESAIRITRLTQSDGESVSVCATEFRSTLEHLRGYEEYCLSDFTQTQLFISGLNAHTRTNVSSLPPRTLEAAVDVAVTIPTADDNKNEGENPG